MSLIWRIFSIIFILFHVQNVLSASNGTELLELSIREITLIVGEVNNFTIRLIDDKVENLNVTFVPQHGDIVQVEPPSVSFVANIVQNAHIIGINPGHSDVILNVSLSDQKYVDDKYIKVTVQHSNALYHISTVVGWLYFVAWSVSFYPQMYTNYKRKSVVGLNFDFLSLNIIGFILYSLFNIGLYFIPLIKEEYFDRHPRGLNPVQINDIFFSVHATLATLFTIFQCFIYERNNQTVSWTAKGIMAIFLMILAVSSVLSSLYIMTWLDFLYYCSYIKLSITLIKYIPQAYMNYKRKSTLGWSIGNIFLDFIGGMLSMLQMILNGYNYDDWVSIFGDPTKFGLGLFSVVFDVFFIIQHYILYRNQEPYQEIGNDINVEDETENAESC